MTANKGVEFLGFDDINSTPSGSQFLSLLTRYGSKYGKRHDSIDRARRDMLIQRFDAVDPGQGFHFVKDLEHTYAEVLREKRPLLNGFEMFTRDTSVPVGARTHRVKRIYHTGEAVTYRRGRNIPKVNVAQKEEIFPIRHYVTSAGWSIFDEQSSDFAGTQLVAELTRTMRDVIEEHANYRTWYGSEEDNLYGVLTYPYLRKKVIPTPFNDSAASTEDILRELHLLANFPYNNGRQAFAPNTMVTSPRVRSFLFRKRMAADSDTTIGKFFLDTNPHINAIEQAHELQDPGASGIDQFPVGRDVILVYRNDRMGITNVIPRPFGLLPPEDSKFEREIYGYMTHGGVIMRDSGNNILGIVEPTGLF